MTTKVYNSGQLELKDLQKGDRIELHPATDRWMMGDRYGTVTSVTKKGAYCRMDKSNRKLRVPADDIGAVLEKPADPEPEQTGPRP